MHPQGAKGAKSGAKGAFLVICGDKPELRLETVAECFQDLYQIISDTSFQIDQAFYAVYDEFQRP